MDDTGDKNQLDLERSSSSGSGSDREHAGVPAQAHKVPLLVRFRDYFEVQLSHNYGDFILFGCSLITGLLDSVIFSAYGTFVSMQTGNTIFLGLGASTSHENDSYGWAKSGTSILCFTIGAGFFARFCRYLGPGKRKTFVLSFLLQCVLVWAMAGVVQGKAVVGDISTAMQVINWREELPIALLSFQAAGQIVCSRNLAMSELPTVVLTSVMCDFASDPKILDGPTKNLKRNRRLFGFVCLLVGAIAGGWIGKATGGVQYVLWLAGGIKFLLALAWVLWPKKEETLPS